MGADDTDNLVAPHGGELIDLLATGARAAELEVEARELRRLTLTPRQLCDIEQLVTGGFSPLKGFMGRRDYEGVRDEMRLSDGTLWPMPIVLDISGDFAAGLGGGDRLALMHPEGVLLAVLTVGDVWEPDREAEAQQVFGTTNLEHPGVNSLLTATGSHYVGGDLEAVRSARHHTYAELRHTPAELRQEFAARGWNRVVAFQTRNPMHRAHVELTRRAAHEQGANLLIHPVVGLTKPGDVEHHTRVRCYRAVIGGYPENSATLSLLQLAMRMGGPREAVWHAIVRKNYGCSHLIVGRDHAGPGSASDGTPFYGPYEAQELVEQHAAELGISIVSFQMVVYDAKSDRYATQEELGADADVRNISGTDLRELLSEGADIPEWFSFPEVVAELRRSYPPKSRRGIVVAFTGDDTEYSEAAADVLSELLLEDGTRQVSRLSGGSSGLETTALVGREVARNGGALIAVSAGDVDGYGAMLRDAIDGVGEYLQVDVASATSEYDVSADVATSSDGSPPGDAGRVVFDRLRELGLVGD